LNYPVTTDILLNLLHDDGYSLGEVVALDRGVSRWHLDASKDGERYVAATMLMELCGWDLKDG